MPSSKKLSGDAGILPESKEALPFIRINEILPMIFFQVSDSSSPVCLAKAAEIFLIALFARSSHPPKDSKTSGINLSHFCNKCLHYIPSPKFVYMFQVVLLSLDSQMDYHI